MVQNEKELIEKAKHDPQVFAQLYDIYYPRILNYITRRVGNVKISADITSETFFKAFKHLWQFKWRNISFSSWLYKIANNEIYTYFRKHKYSTTSLDSYIEKTGYEPYSKQHIEQEILEAEEQLQQHKDFLQVQKHILQLDIKYQEVIHLRFFENKKTREIAEILGKNENTVKSLLARGVEKLKEMVESVNEIK
jgi:RNA polymerase sigma-70 factor, ECF subfamily